jgi:hypothetical protein
MTSQKYSIATKQFHSTFRSERTKGDRNCLLQLILAACESAERYEASQDKMYNLRVKDRDAKDNRVEISRALRKIEQYVTNHRVRSSLALASVGYKGCKSDSTGTEATASFSKLLIHMNNALTAMEDGPGAAWLHTVSSANLILPSAVRSRRKPPVAMGLLFELVYYFRNFTAGMVEFWPHQMGETMPDHGDPHYELGALFVATALGRSISRPGHSLRKYLREHPKVGLGEWPKIST